MGYKMIEITQEKQSELAEHAEKVLKHAGKLMQCIEDMCDEEENDAMMGQRFGGRYNGNYGQMQGMRGGSMGERGRMGRRIIDPYYE